MKYMKLIILISVICGLYACKEQYAPSGGGSVHIPPAIIEADKPILLTLKLTTWGKGSKDINTRYLNVRCNYKTGIQKKYASIKMSLVKTKPSEGMYQCTIPSEDVKKGIPIDYYFDMNFDGHYNRRSEKTLVATHSTETNERDTRKKLGTKVKPTPSATNDTIDKKESADK